MEVVVDGAKIKFLPNAIYSGSWVQWISRPWCCELPLMNLETGKDPNTFSMSMLVKECKK